DAALVRIPEPPAHAAADAHAAVDAELVVALELADCERIPGEVIEKPPVAEIAEHARARSCALAARRRAVEAEGEEALFFSVAEVVAQVRLLELVRLGEAVTDVDAHVDAIDDCRLDRRHPNHGVDRQIEGRRLRLESNLVVAGRLG